MCYHTPSTWLIHNPVRGITQLTRKISSAVRCKILGVPDFVELDPRNHKLHFVEVK